MSEASAHPSKNFSFCIFLVSLTLFSSPLLATSSQKSQDQWDSHLKSIEDFYEAGYFSEALERAKEFKEFTEKKFPDDSLKRVQARLWLGYIRLQYGELDEAQENLQTAYEILLSTNPRSPNSDALVLLYLGRTLQLQKKTDEALRCFYDVVTFNFYGVTSVDPLNYGLAYLYMAEIYFSQKDHKTGVTWLQEASYFLLSEAPTYPNLTDGLVALGDYYFLNDDLQRAESTYKKALDLHRKLVGDNNPRAADILFKLMQAEFLQKDNRYVWSSYQAHAKELQNHPYSESDKSLCDHLMALQRHCFFPDKCNSVQALYLNAINSPAFPPYVGGCDEVQLCSDLSRLKVFKKEIKAAERVLVRCSKRAKKHFGIESRQYRQSLENLKKYYEENNQIRKATRLERSLSRLPNQ